MMRSLERIVTLLPCYSPSVCLSGMEMHCDYTMHFIADNADLNLRLDSPLFWAPRHQSLFVYSKPSVFKFHLEHRRGIDVQTRRNI